VGIRHRLWEVGNCLPYVCQRTVHLGRKGYKYTIDG
jgi:hypothetical protein